MTRKDARDVVEPASTPSPLAKGVVRDPLVELARELLPEYGAEDATRRSSKAVQLGRELERRSDRLTRLEESFALAKRETNDLVAAKDEALESKTARVADLQIEMEKLRVSVEDARREKNVVVAGFFVALVRIEPEERRRTTLEERQRCRSCVNVPIQTNNKN